MKARRVLVSVSVAAAITVAVAAAGAPFAHGDVTVERQAWAPSAPVSTIADDPELIYVASDLGSESARAFLRLDLTSVPAGLDTGVSVTLVAAEATAVPDDLVLLACTLTTPLVGSGKLSSESAPEHDCEDAARAVSGPNGTWSVALDKLLPRWRSGPNHGFALVSTVADATTFRLGFDPAKTAVVVPASAATPAAPAPTPAPSAPATAAVPPSAAAAAPTIDLALPALAPALEDTAAAAPDDSVAAARPASPEAPARPPARLALPNAASPPAIVVLGLVALAAAGAVVLASRRRRPGRFSRPVGEREALPIPGGTAVGAMAALLVLPPLLLDETNTYKLGLVMVLLVGAIGLHLLVNWAGELSLAQSALIGLPAFVVAKLSGDLGVSPILLLPVGILVGLVAGGVVGMPAIRARGLQVALVTLAAGVAIDRFFFTREWVVGGAGGTQVPVPTLGPIRFATARSLYPVLAILVVLAVAAAWLIYRSKVGRGLLWVKAHQDGAAAFGIPVSRYRAIAYAIAGAYAGFAGGLTAMWVQRLTPDAFPLSRSFTYLIIVALAGRGFIGGVAMAAAIVEGGRLFLPGANAIIAYSGPVGLILTLTRYRAGLNGMGRELADRIRSLRGGGPSVAQKTLKIRPLVLAGVVAIALGFGSIVLAWYHAGNTSQVWIQNQELLSGGVGGLALVLLGIGLLVYDGLSVTRAADADRWERVLKVLEDQAARVEQAAADEPNGNGRTAARRRPLKAGQQ